MAFFAPLMAMRFIVAVCVMALTFGRACAGPLPEEIVARQIHSIVPSDGAGGVAVVLRLGGRTSFFNYGWADRVNEKPVTTDSLFNLASLRKVFDATLLARSVRDGALRLDNSLRNMSASCRVIFAASRSASSPPTPPACCYLKTIRLGRTGATHYRSSSAL